MRRGEHMQTSPDYEPIKALIAQGEKYEYISRVFKTSQTTLNNIRKEMGLPPRKKKVEKVLYRGRWVYPSYIKHANHGT
jgi:hypothetical protein